MPVLLGCIADDLTGATDLAAMLVRGGMRVVQTVGLPADDASIDDVEGMIVSLKSRNIDPQEAVDQSLAALNWLANQGARHFYFKYCSTFDSTDRGNIGPVASALLDSLGEEITIACPAFPENGRTVYQGHLFVGDRLLSESGMEHHPLTPMTDPDLVRVLGRQTKSPVGLVPHATVSQGASAIRQKLDCLYAQGCRIAIVDATNNNHLECIASACSQLRLLTGGSALASELPKVFRERGMIPATRYEPQKPDVPGWEAVISGSCSPRTLEQVECFKDQHPAFGLDPQQLVAGDDIVEQALEWAKSRLGDGPVLIYSSAPPDSVARLQEQIGRQAAGRLIERLLARISVGLVDLGVRRMVIAGGETSGAVLESLGIKMLRLGPEIDPGVPWTQSVGQPSLALALKSGNFGEVDFFSRALEMLR